MIELNKEIIEILKFCTEILNLQKWETSKNFFVQHHFQLFMY